MTDANRRLMPFLILGGLVFVLLGTTVFFARDEYQDLARESGETIGTQTTIDEKVGDGRVRLDQAAIAASGVAVAPLQAAEADPTIEVFGTVVDIKPLVEARGRYLAQSAEIRALRVVATTAEAEFKRADALYHDERNVSERVMRQAEGDWKGARERLAAAEAAVRGTVDTLRAEWGATLADMAVNGGSAAFAPLLNHAEVLLQMTIPFDSEPAAAKRPLRVTPAGGSASTAARLLAAAPSSASGGLGATYYYRAPVAGFRTGARVVGHLGVESGKAAGVVVPERAVVWYAGRPWVYVRDEKEKDIFERAPVSASQLLPGGWFNAEGLEAGQEVVVTGAQLLLSEELEYQIRNENED